jgi:UDPglucose 6-dehydrogenase
MKLSVLGLGYLGATQAIVLAEMGHRVLGLDPDQRKVSALQEGRLPFFEPGLQELLEKALSSGRLTFETEYDEKLNGIDLHFLCVGTPALNNHGDVDLSAVFAAGTSVAKFLGENAVIVGRSTVPIGTAAELKRRIAEVTDVPYSLAWNPEFLSEGTAITDSIRPDRIVVGADTEHAVVALREVYEPQLAAGVPFLVMDIPTSELVKVASNSFLAMKISFINGVAEVAEKSGASTGKLAEAMGFDPRIGKKFLQNGLGFGGGCLPKDLAGFTQTAAKLGVVGLGKLLGAAAEINEDRVAASLKFALEKLGDLTGKKVAILGIAFKPNTDDSRESPGLKLARGFVQMGARVSIHDPIAKANSSSELLGEFTTDLDEALEGSEVAVIATEWPQFGIYKPKIDHSLGYRLVIDGRSIIDEAVWVEAGWDVFKLGEGRKFPYN